MKNIIKIMFSFLTAGALITSVNAGELSVTGTAKATYNIIGSDDTAAASEAGKGLGIANEFHLGASGELDNGMSWNYKISMDPNNTAGGTNGEVQNDDSSLTLSTDYGTIGIFVKAGGLDVDNTASQSVYGRPSDTGYGEDMVDEYGIDAYSSVQWHSPAGMLPYSTTIKVGHAPSRSGDHDSSNGSASRNGAGTDNGTQTAYQIKTVPMDGMGLGLSYNVIDGANATEAAGQKAESGSIYATYAVGSFSLGASVTRRAEAMPEQAAGTADVRGYNNNKASVAFNVNDNLSVSYERERSSREQNVDGTDEFDIQSHGIQAAYTMGGMTLAVSRIEHENAGYTENKDAHNTIFAATMAF